MNTYLNNSSKYFYSLQLYQQEWISRLQLDKFIRTHRAPQRITIDITTGDRTPEEKNLHNLYR